MRPIVVLGGGLLLLLQGTGGNCPGSNPSNLLRISISMRTERAVGRIYLGC